MSFFDQLKTMGADGATITLNTLDGAAESLWKLVFLALGAIVLMWLINISGMEGLNFLFYFAGAILIGMTSFAPQKLIAVLGLGTVAAPAFGLRPVPGAKAAFDLYTKIVSTILLYFLLAAGFLATWSFEANPGAFFPMFASVVMIGFLQLYYQKSGEWTYALAMAYNLILLGMMSVMSIAPGIDEAAMNLAAKPLGAEFAPLVVVAAMSVPAMFLVRTFLPKPKKRVSGDEVSIGDNIFLGAISAVLLALAFVVGAIGVAILWQPESNGQPTTNVQYTNNPAIYGAPRSALVQEANRSPARPASPSSTSASLSAADYTSARTGQWAPFSLQRGDCTPAIRVHGDQEVRFKLNPGASFSDIIPFTANSFDEGELKRARFDRNNWLEAAHPGGMNLFRLCAAAEVVEVTIRRESKT
ncbi:MAG: hypothetical protein ACOC4E_01670 [Patescibacteria group bacterium]